MTGPTAMHAAPARGRAAPSGGGLVRHGRAFLSWWLAEISGLLPESMRGLLSGSDRRAGILLADDTLRLIDLRGGQHKAVASVKLAGMSTAEGRDAVRGAIGRGGLRDCRIVLGLPESMILRRAESLPAGAGRRLEDILRLRLENTAPLPAGAFHWGYRVRGPAVDGRLPVECVLVKAESVEALVKRLTELGIQLDGVFPASDLSGEPTLNLLPPHLRRDRAPLWSPLNRGLAALAVTLGVISIAMSFYRQEAELRTLDTELANLRERAKTVMALRTQAQTHLETLQAARTAKANAPSPMGILHEVSRLFPDGTWASDFRLTGNEVQLIGQSQSASSLIGLIDRSPSFANVRFGSPVVRDPQTGEERFNLQFEWVSGERPAARTTTDSSGGGR